MEYTVEWLARYDIREIIINLHYRQEVIRRHFGDGSRWGVLIRYSPEQRLLGTAGGVKAVEDFFDETFLVWYGDNLCRPDLAKMVSFHRAKRGIATLALFNRSDLASSGIVALDDNNRVCRFVEKPTSEEVFSYLINAGIYILEPAIFKYIPPDTSCDFGRDIFPALLEGGEEIYGYRLTVPLFWIDTPEDYERAQKDIKEGRLG